MKNNNKTAFKDTDMQLVIGRVLQAGVLISMSVVFIGGIIYLWRHSTEHLDYTAFKGVPDFVHTLPGILNGIFDLRGRAIIQAGIILLIATPVLRIIFSAIGFALEKDRLYFFITLLVLAIIITGALTGKAG